MQPKQSGAASFQKILDRRLQLEYKYCMKIVNADAYLLKIPFKMSFSHSKADRFFCDSVILELTALDDDGMPVRGWGEAVIREYVGGRMEGGRTALSATFGRLLNFAGLELDRNELLDAVRFSEASEAELPLLCAAETAVLDLLCKASGCDIYGLLERAPVRSSLTYGGTLPILPLRAAEKLLGAYAKLGIGNLRLKLSANFEQNRDTVALARKILGEKYDLKVDANAGWTLADAEKNIPMLRSAGISIIEEPFGREEAGKSSITELKRDSLADGMLFMADESALTAADIRRAAEEKSFDMFNLRLAKSGGLLKTLGMAEQADELGLGYMAGCHVGETGILSAAGRAAASLMSRLLYCDGSYDEHLLKDNITTENLSFGPGGRASVIRNTGLGYEIDESKLKEYSDEQFNIL